MMNPSQPMTSCDAANSWMMCGRFNALEHLEHVVEPLPQRYRSRRDCRSGWDLFSLSHLSIISADCSKASNLPPSGHQAMCEHVSAQPLQLDTYGIYHLGGPERTLFLLCQGHVLQPRSGRAGEDCAVCGGWRSSLLH